MPNDRLIPEHFKRDGTPKKPFSTREEAGWVGDTYNQEPYECDFCGKWHLANREKR